VGESLAGGRKGPGGGVLLSGNRAADGVEFLLQPDGVGPEFEGVLLKDGELALGLAEPEIDRFGSHGKGLYQSGAGSVIESLARSID
jgi:hypothetical protein